MKKTILFGICIALFSCSKSESNDGIKENANTANQKVLNKGTSSSTMNYLLVKNMIDNYKNNQLKSIQNSGSNPVSNDAQAIWFDVETLKKFISEIESQTANNSGDVSKLGIRFYYAAYPEKSKWGQNGYEDLSDLLTDPITQMYEKKHTLIMIPTLNVGGTDKDFNPLDKNTYNGFNSSNNSLSNYEIMSVSDNELSTSARNHGTLYPPDSMTGFGF